MKSTARKFTKWLLNGICLTSIAFVFQACYGGPRDFGLDVKIEGTILNTEKEPLSDVQVSFYEGRVSTRTDSEGKFKMYMSTEEQYSIKLEGEGYAIKDTVIKGVPDSLHYQENKISLVIELEKN